MSCAHHERPPCFLQMDYTEILCKCKETTILPKNKMEQKHDR